MDKPLAILLIHGFGGSVQEVEPLAQRLEKAGFFCQMVALAGHAPALRPIEKLSWRAWVDSARQVYQNLAEGHRVAVVGFSMGGLIAALLNKERPFSKILFVNTPIYFWHVPQILRNLVGDFSAAFRYYFIKSGGRVSLSSMVQFLRLLLAARPCFEQVDCPVLVVQAEDDDTVWPASATFISRRVRGDSGIHRPKGGGHLVLLDEGECKEIAALATVFFGESQ